MRRLSPGRGLRVSRARKSIAPCIHQFESVQLGRIRRGGHGSLSAPGGWGPIVSEIDAGPVEAEEG
eukprot:1401073-Alexandrium_andersonii.AAC.1